MAQKVLGVDVSAHTIKLALVSNEKRPKILAADIVAMPSGAWANDTLLDGKAVAHAISGAVLSNKLMSRTEAIAVCVNTPQTVVRPIKLPMLSDKELRPAIEFELTKSFPGIGKTHAIAFREYGRTKEAISGIVSFSPLRTLDAYKEIVDAFNYKDAYLDVSPNCEAKAYLKFCAAEKENKAVMILEAGLEGSTITVLEKGEIRHSRYVAEGAGQFADYVCERNGTSPERFFMELNGQSEPLFKGVDRSGYQRYMLPIATEARQTLEFYAAGAPPEALPVAEVLLAGDCALYEGFAEYLSSVVGLGVRAMKPASAAPDTFIRLIHALGAAVREG
ncbi:MAG: pilus assembly protein PilM [Clostridiaceae bacterium]|nr:pilus assembly protein PilM [Eubacteriales bacterium]